MKLNKIMLKLLWCSLIPRAAGGCRLLGEVGVAGARGFHSGVVLNVEGEDYYLLGPPIEEGADEDRDGRAKMPNMAFESVQASTEGI
jgi:hypothetical protein